MIEVDLRKEVLEWALVRSERNLADLEAVLPELSAWRSGELKPSFEQLEQLAKETLTPVGLLFLPEPPQAPFPLPFSELQRTRDQRDRRDEDLDRLQTYLLELERGFCLEARDKCVIIGNRYKVVDLVFYHRFLKCHILVQLNDVGLREKELEGLNRCVSWYAEHQRLESEELPVGLLLSKERDELVVDYALAGLTEEAFESGYRGALPSSPEFQERLGEVRSW